MSSKLRPTGLGSGSDKSRPDYAVRSGAREVVRIYRTRGGPDGVRGNAPRPGGDLGRG